MSLPKKPFKAQVRAVGYDAVLLVQRLDYLMETGNQVEGMSGDALAELHLTMRASAYGYLRCLEILNEVQ